jgi:hypothetical protein
VMVSVINAHYPVESEHTNCMFVRVLFEWVELGKISTEGEGLYTSREWTLEYIFYINGSTRVTVYIRRSHPSNAPPNFRGSQEGCKQQNPTKFSADSDAPRHKT